MGPSDASTDTVLDDGGGGGEGVVCPGLSSESSPNPKIRYGTGYLESHASDIFAAAVTIDDGWADTCPAPSGSIGCSYPIESQLQRSKANQRAAFCLGQDLATVTSGRPPTILPIWYDPPTLDSDGFPIAIGRSFVVPLTLRQIHELARSPSVATIGPAPGMTASVPVIGMREWDICPNNFDEPMAKVVDAQSIRGMGRQSVVVEYQDNGVLPPWPECAGGISDCDTRLAALWLRTILNTREITCVAQWISSTLEAPPGTSLYSSGAGTLVPTLPPFGQSPATVKARGMILSWDEAVQVARHPYVERIWASGSAVSMPEVCHPDLESPIANPLCPDAREPIGNKISPENQERFRASEAPNAVNIRVMGGALVCSLAGCTGACPDPEVVHARWIAENAAAQSCVRDLISGVGGTASDEVFWLVNAFSASLTWSQIQIVATHPHVLRVDSNL